MARGRHAHRRVRGAVIAGAVIALLAVAAGGAAYAAYRHELANGDRILPGVRIADVDVGGMSRSEATAALTAAVADELSSSVSVRLGGQVWNLTREELGRRALIADAVDEALALNQEHGTFDRFWHRFRATPVDIDLELSFATQGRDIERLVDSIAADVLRSGRDAAVTISPDGDDIRFIRPRDGVKLARIAALRRIGVALERGLPAIELETVPLAPKVTVRELGPTIVVRVDRNRLDLYDGFDLVKSWDVATAKPGYVTPSGDWTIWDMRENPTWYNPALDDWGADLPAVIPGGPGNPMGTRALYIDAPGLIRIHGTTDPSSIGRYASHGCIRMRNEEVEDLFERVPIGTHVLVVGSRPAGADYWDTPAASDI